MNLRTNLSGFVIASVLFAVSCQRDNRQSQNAVPTALSEVPAARLNFRYEPDVPGPAENNSKNDERNAAVQADFDQSRPQEILDKTIASPDIFLKNCNLSSAAVLNLFI